MGVLMKSGSILLGNVAAERGVAVVADAISDGKVAVAGVESFSSLGFVVGIIEVRDCVDAVWWRDRKQESPKNWPSGNKVAAEEKRARDATQKRSRR